MSDPSTEVQIALLIAGQKSLTEQLEDVESELAALKLERDKALRWGVLSLGGAVMAMASYIFKHLPWSGS